ncbi:MAG: ABC transporter ATP-binding protein [Conexibacter sp.]
MTDEREFVLEVSDLVAAYGQRRKARHSDGERQDEVRVVDGVSLQVRRGEMLALVGESGSGKTTTARAIARLIEPRAGEIRFIGEDVTHVRGSALRMLRRRLQLVYQDPYEALNPRFRVQAILEEPRRVQGMARARGSQRELVEQALERVGLRPAERFLRRYPHELSGGQRQRVAIAASLMTEPELLIADEPVSMLDVSVRAGVLELLRKLQHEEQLAVLMITHDLATAAHVADRIAVFYMGRVVEEGPARQIIEAPSHPYTRALLSVVPERAGERQAVHLLPGEPPDPTALPSGCRFRTRCPLAFEQCEHVDPALRVVAARGDAHRAACLLVETPEPPAPESRPSGRAAAEPAP